MENNLELSLEKMVEIYWDLMLQAYDIIYTHRENISDIINHPVENVQKNSDLSINNCMMILH